MELTSGKTEARTAAERLRDLAGGVMRWGHDDREAVVGLSEVQITSEWGEAHPDEAAMTWPQLLRDIADQAEREAAGGTGKLPVGVAWPADGDGRPLDTTAAYDLDGARIRIWSISYFGRPVPCEVEVVFDDYSIDATDPRRLHEWRGDVGRVSEPDSWEDIEKDALDKLMPNDAEFALDLVRRARALAEGGEGR